MLALLRYWLLPEMNFIAILQTRTYTKDSIRTIEWTFQIYFFTQPPFPHFNKGNGDFFIAFSLNMWSRSDKIHIILLKIATGEH